MTVYRITPSFTIERDGDQLSVATPHPHKLVLGRIDGNTAGALRALADEIERGQPVTHTEHEQGGLFDNA